MALFLILLWMLTCQAEFHDEMQAHEQNCLGEDIFECFDGTCIPVFEYCDGITDCPDASDESFCPELQDPRMCNGTLNFLCADQKKCILNTLICNNVSDCNDGSDEVNCSLTSAQDNNGEKKANCTGFLCDGNKCISRAWTCDGRYDCTDRTDEQLNLCRQKPQIYVDLFKLDSCDTVREFANSVQKNYRCMDSSFCLPSSMMCDGIVDCRDGSDEGEFCDNWNKVCSSNPCKNMKCLPERHTFYCVCDQPDSQRYNYITSQCEHVDVCNSPRPYCSHLCEVNKTGLNCMCEKGYTSDKSGSVCRAAGPEAMLFYSTITEIGYITLNTKKQVTLLRGIKQTHGVTYDGEYLYWVETAQGHQAIMRAQLRRIAETKEVLVSVGLEEPGDIALDWMGGHIYFSDAERGIIAVCRTNGSMCATLPAVAKYPKFVTLAVKYGKMYWADWHQKPVIMTAQMDGSGSEQLVDNLKNFATGLTVDVPNNRLYYVDHTVKVIRIDNKQTYSLFSEPFYRPYAIAVFENIVYWSDMISNSIQTNNKLHGSIEARRKLLSVNSAVFDMHIYHPLLIGYFGGASSPCVNKSCSHLCLVTSNVTSVCTCPDGMKLNGTTCYHVKEYEQQYLIVGAGKQFTRMQYNTLGNPETHATLINLGWVQAMAHDNVRDTLYIYDGKYKNIESINMSVFNSGVSKILPHRGFVDVVDMDYDYATDSLYILDAGSHFMKVLSLRTNKLVLLHRFRDNETPVSFCIIPEYGKMLIAFRGGKNGYYHIDSLGLDGSDRKPVITNELKGPGLRLRYAHSMDTVYFGDEGNSMIDVINPEGEGRETFKNLPSSVRDLAVTDTYIFWTDKLTQRLFWANIHDITHRIRRFEFSIFPNETHLHLQATRPPPGPNNLLMNHPCLLSSTCSDVCVQSPHPHPDVKKEVRLRYKCLCPPSLLLVEGKCIELVKCTRDEIYCHRSNHCAPKAKRCDGTLDCKFGEDEEDCAVTITNNANGKPKSCGANEIPCNGRCIDKNLNCSPTKNDYPSVQCDSTQWLCKTGSLCVERSQVCDGQTDCPDGTDESLATCDTLSCQEYEFTCTVGSCIMSSFRCDGDADCSDGSDEENCEYKNCTVGHYQCRNRQCVELHKRCDGQVDCTDDSDEQQCEETDSEKDEVTDCADGEYACALDPSICLPATARCNWNIECPGGTDEENCDPLCAPRSEFKCAEEHKCIPKDKVCDGTKECNDGSDETPEACKYANMTSYHRTPPTFLMKECNHGYLCKTGDCVEWRQVCDNIVHCYDGSDENGQCSTACQNNKCSHACQSTPQGPRCQCPQGFQLQNDSLTCVDIDECADDVCSQNCHNVPGNFLCSCHHGYALRADRRSCKAIQGAMSILYVSGNTVRSLSADGNSVLEYYDDNIAKIGGIDTNVREHKIYVTAPDAGKLIQVNGPISSDNVTVVTNIGTPTKVIVDWLTGNVYFVDRGNAYNSSIRVCNVDKKKCAMVQQLFFAKGGEITALVIDPASRRIFYCATEEGESVVWSLSLSGRSWTDLATFRNCTGLAVDSYKKILYVAESAPAQIIKVDLFGDRLQTVVFTHPHLESPQGLIIFEDWVYFLVANSIKLNRCRLYGTKSCQPFIYRMFDANTFVIQHPSVQRDDLPNVCAGHVCSNICVADDLGPQCLCQDGTLDKDGKCEEPKTSLEAAFDGQSTGNSRVNEVAFSVLAAILSLVVMYLGIYAYYRFVERRNRDNSYVEVRFQNTSTSTANVGSVIEMPTNAILPGVASSSSTTAAHEFVNPLQFVRNLVNRSQRRTTRPIGTAGLNIIVPNTVDTSSDTESDLDDKDTQQFMK